MTSIPAGEIIALIPAYNESRYIADVVARAQKHVPVIVIDDGSSDDTAAVATLAGAEVIAHPTNQGKGMALNTGFDYAVQQGVDAAITLDADGQHDPDEIPLFIEAFHAGQGDRHHRTAHLRADARQKPVRQSRGHLAVDQGHGPAHPRQPERLSSAQPRSDGKGAADRARASRPR